MSDATGTDGAHPALVFITAAGLGAPDPTGTDGAHPALVFVSVLEARRTADARQAQREGDGRTDR
jgi:hypothetical protein